MATSVTAHPGWTSSFSTGPKTVPVMVTSTVTLNVSPAGRLVGSMVRSPAMVCADAAGAIMKTRHITAVAINIFIAILLVFMVVLLEIN